MPGAANPQAWDRYAYVNNSPVNFSDPSGHMYERGGYDLEPGGEYADYVYNIVYDNNTRQVNQAKVETTVTVVEVVASVAFEPLDWYYTGMDIADGNFSPLMLLGLLPFVPHSAASKLDEVLVIGRKIEEATEGTEDILKNSDEIVEKIHGNSHNSPRLTYLFELTDINDNHLKFGITSETNPLNRYTKKFMSDKNMKILNQGTRRDMYRLENDLIIKNPRGSLQLNNH